MKSRFFNGLRKLRRGKSKATCSRKDSLRRGIFETLEDRRLLAAIPISQIKAEDMVAGELIVGFTDSAPQSVRNQIIGNGGEIIRRWDRFDMVLARADGDLEATATQWASSPYVKYAEPNLKGTYTAFNGVFPDDPLFPQLWGLHNGGQIPNFGNPAPIPIEDSDIDAPEAWSISAGTSDAVIAIFDSGTDYTHPDLSESMWINPGEIPGNSIDDDGNGFIDDIYGIDTFNLDSDPMDDMGHGTHVSGTAAATGDNGIGVTGVSWNAQIMAMKIGDPAGPTSAAVIDGLAYTIMMKEDFGINIVASNHSYGLGILFEQGVYDAFQAHIDAGILPVIAAGNNGTNNDMLPSYPANYDWDGSLVVAATDKDDTLATFSQYGRTTVDLAAPGVDILSTALRINGVMIDPSGYLLSDGTSMASPFVTGAVAVLRSLDPSLSVLESKEIIMGGVDKLSDLRRLVVSEGRLNLDNSLRQIVSGQIRGILWNDINGNAQMNFDEIGLDGWTVFLDTDADGRLDSGEQSTVTNIDGAYRLPVYSGAGTYTVSVLERILHRQTYPAPLNNMQEVVLEYRDQVVGDVDFGYQPEPAKVSGVKWNDLDGDRRRDPDEPGLKNWLIYVDIDGDGRLDVGEPQTLTDQLGRYTLEDVPATNVTIHEIPQVGWVQTFPGGDGYWDLNLEPLEHRKDIDFGNNESMANDWSDAPAPYPTLAADNGPRHAIMAGVHLGPSILTGGAGVDAEADGFQDPAFPDVTDDTTNLDDEDGVVFLSGPAPGGNGVVQVTVTLGDRTPGMLQAWIDFNSDGDWDDAGEQIFRNLRLDEGVHELTYPVPANAIPGASFSRFRYGYESDLGYTGMSFVGEVEDHPLNILSTDPIAVDDAFTVQQNSLDNELDVLDNDIPGISGRANMKLASVNDSGASGTAVIDNNGTPDDYTDDFVSYSPAPGALAPDSFTYRIEDVLTGASSSATVSITINESGGLVPIAVDDSYTVSTTTNLNVLLNDRRGPTGVIVIPANGLDTTGTLGNAQLINVNVGGSIEQRIQYTPPPQFTGADQFRYTIEDSNSIQDTATVTIHIPTSTEDDVIRFRLEATDLLGNPITQVGQGMQFQIRGYIKDMRGQTDYPDLPPDLTPTEQGVFSAYMDMLYDSGLVAYAGPTSFSNDYPSGQFYDATVPGILDEVGAFQGVTSGPLGPQEQLLYSATFTATAKGVAIFKSDPADNLPLHETTLNHPPEPPASFNEIEFGTASLQIVELPNLVQIELRTTDLNGDPISDNRIAAGSEFNVQAWVNDIRGITQEGLFSAYLDVFYNPSLALPVPSVTNPLGFDISFTDELNNPFFWPNGQKGNFNASGIIDEVGAFQGNPPDLFTPEKLLFTVRFRALTPTGGVGTLVFRPDPADNQPLNEITLIKPDPGLVVPPAQVIYVDSNPLTVIATGGEAEFTNPDNPYDVNGDGFTSPMDVLVLISFLNENGSVDLTQWFNGAEGEAALGYYFDANNDRVISPLDALVVTTYLNDLARANAAAGEGEIASASVITAASGVYTNEPLQAPVVGQLVWQDGDAQPQESNVPHPASWMLDETDTRQDTTAWVAGSDDVAREQLDLDLLLTDDLLDDISGAWGIHASLDELMANSV